MVILAAIAAVRYYRNNPKHPVTNRNTREFRHTVELDDFDAHWLELETLEYRYELEYK
jgi:hypothetical protein